MLNALALEEIAYGDAALAVAVAGALGFVRAIATQGTDAQREQYLPAFRSETPAFAAVAALDAGWFRGAGHATRAEREGNRWRIEGAKALVPLPARCDRLVVTARTDDGVRAFIVDARAAGVRIEPAKGTLGLRALQMADVVFERRRCRGRGRAARRGEARPGREPRRVDSYPQRPRPRRSTTTHCPT